MEDEAIIALSEKMTLEKHGYAVTIASSGPRAVEAVRDSDPFDLILMDIDLGTGMDGTEAAQVILSMADVPVVFLSSHTEPEMVDRTEKITSHGYIVKTSGETVLIASIKMAFRLFESRVNERLALRRLTHSRDLMSYIIRHARSAIAVHDRNLNYLYVSEEYLRSYEVTRQDIIGRHHYEIFPDLPQKWRDVHERSVGSCGRDGSAGRGTRTMVRSAASSSIPKCSIGPSASRRYSWTIGVSSGQCSTPRSTASASWTPMGGSSR